MADMYMWQYGLPLKPSPKWPVPIGSSLAFKCAPLAFLLPFGFKHRATPTSTLLPCLPALHGRYETPTFSYFLVLSLLDTNLAFVIAQNNHCMHADVCDARLIPGKHVSVIFSGYGSSPYLALPLLL